MQGNLDQYCFSLFEFWLKNFLGENGGGPNPNTQPIFGNFWILNIFDVFDISRGQKTLFFQKVSQ